MQRSCIRSMWYGRFRWQCLCYKLKARPDSPDIDRTASMTGLWSSTGGHRQSAKLRVANGSPLLEKDVLVGGKYLYYFVNLSFESPVTRIRESVRVSRSGFDLICDFISTNSTLVLLGMISHIHWHCSSSEQAPVTDERPILPICCHQQPKPVHRGKD